MQKRRLLLLLLPLIAGLLYLRSLASYRPKAIFAGVGSITALVLSHDDKTLLVVQDAQNATLTALDATRGFAPLWSKQGDIYAPQFFASDTRLIAGNTDRTQILETRTGKSLGTYDAVGDRVLSPDGNWLLSRPSATHLAFQFVGKASSALKHPTKSMIIGDEIDLIQHYDFAPDGKTFVVATSNPNGTHVDFYDVPTGKRLRSWPDLHWSGRRTQAGGLLHWSRGGQFLLAFWSLRDSPPTEHKQSVSLWRLRDGQRLASTQLPDDWQTYSGSSDSFDVSTNTRIYGFESPGQNWESAAQIKFQSRHWLDLPKDLITDTVLSHDGSCLFVATQSGHVYRQRLK